MPTYRLYGRRLRSDAPLPELPEDGDGGAAALSFTRRLPSVPGGRWFDIWHEPDGTPWVRAQRVPDGYHVQYADTADFRIDAARHAIEGAPTECSEDMFRHFLVDQVVPLMLSLRGLVVHASAVVDGGAMAAFAGPGGSGKSTLAMALMRLGRAIASDDGLLVVEEAGGVRAVPAYPGVRLWRDSEQAVAAGCGGAGRPHAVAKQRLTDGIAFADRPARLTHLLVLHPESAPAIAFERLTPRDTVMALVPQTFRLALDDPSALARQLDELAAVARRLPGWRLSFPRVLDDWRALAEAVDAHLRHHVAGGGC